MTTRAEEKAIANILLPYVHDESNAFIISSDFCHWGKAFRYTAYTPNIKDLSAVTTGLSYNQSLRDKELEEEHDWDELRNTELVDLTSFNSKTELKKDVTIADSVEFLDRQGLAVLSLGDPEQWDEYITTTKNTICGERPLSVLLNTISSARQEKTKQSNGTSVTNGNSNSTNGVMAGDEHWGVLKWIGYKQSERARALRDTSVSYASGFAVI